MKFKDLQMGNMFILAGEVEVEGERFVYQKLAHEIQAYGNIRIINAVRLTYGVSTCVKDETDVIRLRVL